MKEATKPEAAAIADRPIAAPGEAGVKGGAKGKGMGDGEGSRACKGGSEDRRGERTQKVAASSGWHHIWMFKVLHSVV